MIKKFFSIALLCSLPLVGFSAEELGQPEIVIRQMEDKVIHEYRINGFTYAIKVIPENGKPYFLVAENGESFTSIEQPRVLIPKWTIFSWK